MADEPKGGAAPGEEAGKAGDTPAPEPTETAAGDHEGADDAAAAAQAARDEYLATLVATAVEKAISKLQPAGATAPAATPPTAGRSAADIAELEAEQAYLQTEGQRIERAMQAEGLTAQLLLDHQRLVQREGRWLAKVNLVATQRSERAREVSSVGTEAEWNEFVSRYPPGTDITLMRKAFMHDQAEAKAKAGEGKPKPPARPAGGERVVVDVSGAHEVTAGEKRARTMTRDQAEAHKQRLRDNGDTDGLIAFGKQIRSREVILKD